MLVFRNPQRFLAVAMVFLAFVACADDSPPLPSAGKPQKTMKMNEPMTTEMMKPGMKKADVKAASERKSKAMQPMMELEQKSMSAEKTKP